MKKQFTITERLLSAKYAMDNFLAGKNHFPANLRGKAGSGKTNFAKEYLNSLGIEYIFNTVPDEGSYKSEIEKNVSAYQGGFSDYLESLESDKLEGTKEKQEIEIPYVIIDESHHLISELDHGMEQFQHEKTALKINEVEIPYKKLIFISHKGGGKNNSENTRLTNIEIPSPTREEIMETMIQDLGFSKSKAQWAVTHSKANFRTALDTASAYGTDLQKTYLPRGFSQSDIDVLWFYFRTDPNIQCELIPESEKLPKGANALNNCASFLGMDNDPIKGAESNLKEEGFLSTGSQSKRIISTNEKTFKTILAVLKFSGKFNNPEKEKEKEKEKPKGKSKPAKPAQSKAKPSAKPQTKRKPAQSKQPNKAPKMTGKSRASDIANEINSDNLKKPNPLDKVGE